MIPWLTNFFGSPWLLWGVGLASAPLVIHLLYRRRFRETSWAAMRFLLEAARKNARRLRLEQWLLLALRTL
ncbi:MAG: BatA domain-containing protein, partial [Planctomycetaceae bacterium]